MARAFDAEYRPKKLSDIIGQEVATKILTNSFKAKKMHQAYIFAGNFGCGKTTAARVIAAMKNCKKGPTLEPCGVCTNCKAIFSGTSLDVKEIDAASNRSIDDIRELKLEIRHSPINCKERVVIIDEAHSLTGVAAESALKMIEEPPPNVTFILCTTDPHLLKETIHSRCILLVFNKISWIDILQNLTDICKKEKINFEEDALKIIAKSSRGSARNSLKNLEKVISFADENQILTAADATKVLGAVDDNLYFHLIDSIIGTKAPKAMKVINKILIDGKEIEQVIKGLVYHLRRLLIAKSCADNLAEFDFSEDEIKRFSYQSGLLHTQQIIDMIDLISEINKGISFSIDPQTLLEKFSIQAMFLKERYKTK